MTAPTDAVSRTGETRGGMPRWVSFLLTLAVIDLIYLEVPPPIGADDVKEVLRLALPIIGGLLLTQCFRYVMRLLFTFGRTISNKVKRSISWLRDYKQALDEWRVQRDRNPSDRGDG